MLHCCNLYNHFEWPLLVIADYIIWTQPLKWNEWECRGKSWPVEAGAVYACHACYTLDLWLSVIQCSDCWPVDQRSHSSLLLWLNINQDLRTNNNPVLVIKCRRRRNWPETKNLSSVIRFWISRCKDYLILWWRKVSKHPIWKFWLQFQVKYSSRMIACAMHPSTCFI